MKSLNPLKYLRRLMRSEIILDNGSMLRITREIEKKRKDSELILKPVSSSEPQQAPQDIME